MKLFLPLYLLQFTFSFNTYLDPSRFQGIAASSCVRLLDSSGEFGCKPGLVSGVIKHLKSAAELESHFSQTYSYQFVLLLSYSIFQNLLPFIKHQSIAAIVLVLNDTDRPTSFSTADQCPNCKYSLYPNSTYNWNNASLKLINEFPFSILTISTNSFNRNFTLNELIEAAYSNQLKNFEFPLYSVQLDSPTNAAIDSATCLRNKRCIPIGGYSVWSTFTNLTIDRSKPIIVISSQIDSDSFIKSEGRSASTLTGAISALLIADALRNVSNSFKKTVLFTFFAAESFGYGGSQRFVQDISSFVCKSTTPNPNCNAWTTACSDPCVYSTDFTKIDFNKIEGILDFSNLMSFSGVSSDFYLHTDDTSDSGNIKLAKLFNGFYNERTSSNSTLQINLQSASSIPSQNLKLPPSSIQSFLRKKKIPGVSISDFKTSFSNLYYNSEFDDASNINQFHIDKLCAISTIAAQNVYNWASSNDQLDNINENRLTNITANCTLAAILLDCFTRNATCLYFQQYVQDPIVPSFPGFFGFNGNPSVPSFFIQQIIGFLTGTVQPDFENSTCISGSECDTNSDCYMGKCIVSMTRYHAAYGSGLQYNVKDKSWTVIGDGSAWVYSTYPFSPRARIFYGAGDVYSGISLLFSLLLSLVTGILLRNTKFALRIHASI